MHFYVSPRCTPHLLNNSKLGSFHKYWARSRDRPRACVEAACGARGGWSWGEPRAARVTLGAHAGWLACTGGGAGCGGSGEGASGCRAERGGCPAACPIHLVVARSRAASTPLCARTVHGALLWKANCIAVLTFDTHMSRKPIGYLNTICISDCTWLY